MTLKQFETHEKLRMIANIILAIVITFISLFIGCNAASAQTHMPDTVTIRLSQRDLFAISQRIDSLQNAMIETSVLPANQVTSFNQRLNLALSVMYIQLQRQMVADKPKVPVAPIAPKKKE